MKKHNRSVLRKSRLTRAAVAAHSLAVIALSQFAASSAHAGTYYWDNNSTSGFGSAGGTWDGNTGTGNLWSIDSTGNAAVTSNYQTSNADLLNFGS